MHACGQQRRSACRWIGGIDVMALLQKALYALPRGISLELFKSQLVDQSYEGH